MNGILAQTSRSFPVPFHRSQGPLRSYPFPKKMDSVPERELFFPFLNMYECIRLKLQVPVTRTMTVYYTQIKIDRGKPGLVHKDFFPPGMDFKNQFSLRDWGFKCWITYIEKLGVRL